MEQVWEPAEYSIKEAQLGGWRRWEVKRNRIQRHLGVGSDCLTSATRPSHSISDFGTLSSLAIRNSSDSRWLCGPSSRWVCLYRLSSLFQRRLGHVGASSGAQPSGRCSTKVQRGPTIVNNDLTYTSLAGQVGTGKWRAARLSKEVAENVIGEAAGE